MICRCLCVLAISVIRSCVVQAKFAAPICPNTASMLERCTVLKPWRPGGNIEYTYLVDGNEVTVYMDASTFSMGCTGKADLDNPALPRLEALTGFTKVKLYNCRSHHSYSEALIKLNVTVLTELDVSGVNGLSGNHLAGLSTIQTLEISNSIVADDAFKSSHVTTMRFKDMSPPAFNHLPKSLEILQLISPGTVQIQSDDFKGLSKEFTLIVRGSSGNATVKAGAPLKHLTLSASFVFLSAELVNTLNKVTLIGWGEIRPLPWQNCSIISLNVRGFRAEILPDNWLGDCKNLSLLVLEGAKSPLSLAKDAFKGAIALKEVTLKECKLHELPTGLLKDAMNLEVLNLSGNFLHTLNCMNNHLKTLNLSNNNFTSEVFATISSAEDLEDLDLHDNIHLGTNICNEIPMTGCNNLVRLNLQNTNVRRICNKWRQRSPLLEHLNLSENKITYLRYADLQFTGSISVMVDLTGNNVTHLEYAYDEYSTLNTKNCKVEPDGTQPTGASRAVIQFSHTLQCGCKEAWTALAMKTCPAHVSLKNVGCIGGAELSNVDFKKLACPAKEYCPRKCNCKQVVRPEAPTRVINVMCEHANLTKLPTLPSNASVAWRLHLAYNNISSPLPKDLPPHVLELNLMHNGITQVEVVTSLLPVVSSMHLSGNDLDCSCGTEKGLADLHSHASVVADFGKLKCNDGAPLVVTANCERGIILGSVLGLTPLFVAIIVLIICLVRPSSRSRIKLVLRGLSILPYPPESHEGKAIDVFVASSPSDYERTGKILQWLESGNSPYITLALHRDWLGGAWIPEYAKASVQLSKRIVVLVSKETLTSEEALATFYHAHAVDTKNPGKQPRLVVILLDELDSLPWNNETADLRSYLIENPHLCWSDAWFWTKFRAALAAHFERNGFWTRVRNALHLSYGSTQGDVEQDRMELTQSMSPAEILAKAIVESNRNEDSEVKVNLDAIRDVLQAHSI